MSDGRSSAADSGPESESSVDDGDSSEPGGGPQRVVSDESVDDILDSLNETDATDATDANESDEAATRTRLEGDYVESAPDETTVASSPPAASEPTADATDPADRSADEDGEGGDEDTRGESAAEESADDGSVASDDALDELADRVERGTVTGADVRAAEAGEGREATPAIDDVELTVDDLEETRPSIGSGTGGGGDEPADDAGPLAGSIDADGRPDASGGDPGEPTEQDESTGILGRLVRLFSR
ncbi:hypothetical protein [Halosolutus halophilus]|uniref:hypothetical protein n=1 Tax=Halosolutus halophilus TaxID=1552990 RepID=UPI0022350DA8|nr:hypothetical protein [Halosolutus halophilus]